MTSLVTSAGAASGMDFESIISASVDAKRAQLQKQTTTKKEETNIEVSGVGKLKDALETFEHSLENLTKDNSFNIRKVTTDQGENPCFTVSTKDDASNCDYDIAVEKLATTEKISQDFDKDAGFAKGKITITLPPALDENGKYKKNDQDEYDYRKIEIDVEEGDNLTQVRKKINNNDYGVTASIIVDADGKQRLSIDSGITGKVAKENQDSILGTSTIKINYEIEQNEDARMESLRKRDQFKDASETELKEALKKNEEPAQKLNFDPSKLSEYEQGLKDDDENLTTWKHTPSDDAVIKVDGMKLTSRTNTFDKQISGIELTVLHVTEQEENKPLKTNKLTITQDVDGITAKVQGFVDAYNTLMTTMDGLYKHNTYSDGKNNMDGGELAGDGQLKSLQNTLRNLMTNFKPTGKSKDKNATDVYSIGLTVDKDGRFSLDATKFKEGIADNFNAVITLFTAKGEEVDGKTTGGGLLVQLQNIIKDYTDSDGLLADRQDELNQRIRHYEDVEADNAAYLEKYEESLRQKYSQLDITIASYNNSLNYLNYALG